MKLLLLTIIASIALTVGVWYLRTGTTPSVTDIPEVGSVVRDTVEKEVTKRLPDIASTTFPTKSTGSSTGTLTTVASSTVAKKISITALTPEQRALLDKLGIDVSKIQVTEEMVRCAYDKLGKTRVEAILKGETPSILEAASAVTCYKK
jgi:hypothetical protein